ncbi:MAG: FAD-binding protein [Chloroflexota bacterium]|nr:FAD-binding protein [Chloroflexota bacterium]
MSPKTESAVRTIDTDVLVVGTGGAGLRAAIEARRYGVDVLLADKSLIGLNNNTRWSGAGIRAASRGGVGAGINSPYDSPLEHLKDSLRVGGFLNDQRLAEVFCFDAPSRVLELLDFGLENLSDMMMHCSFPHGTAIVNPLLVTIAKMGVKTYRRLFILDLIREDNSIVGALGFDPGREKLVVIRAKSVILATGGAGEAYARNETATTSTGDGYALAYRAGVELQDMEIVHFEPYVHAEPDLPMMDRHESRAGGFGILRNKFGEDFLPDYIERIGPPGGAFHEQFGVFMPDIRAHVSRAMAMEVHEGRGDKDAVFYDLTHVSEKVWQSDIPSQYLRWVLARGYDLRKTPIHVFPAVICTLGGICINEECETSLAGLYAAGETTGGVHGAMRLSGNALAGTIVFGARAGRSAAKRALSMTLPQLNSRSIEQGKKIVETVLERPASREGDPDEITRQIKSIMWNKVGILRNKAGLESAIRDLDRIESENLPGLFARSGSKVRSAWECINMLTTSQMIARAALLREESRGGHYRLDFPLRDDRKWLKNIMLKQADGGMKLTTQPVVMTLCRPGEMPDDSPIARALAGIDRLNVKRVRGKA